MPFNGSGSFSPPGADFPAVASTLIESTKFNNVVNDIATGLSTAIAKDGQTTVTANIPLSGYKLTGVGAATARTDAATLASIQDGTGVYVSTTGGTADVFTLTPSPAITAYATGQEFMFLAVGTNTTAVTVAINGLAAKAVQSSGSALTGGELVSGKLYKIVYDGTQFQLSLVSVSPFIATLLNDAAASNARTTLGAVGLTGNETVAGDKTFSGNTINSGTVTMSGKSMYWAKGADIVSAATLVLGTDGNMFDVTGSTGPITAITVPAGMLFMLQFDSTPALTHHATNLNLPGGVNITAVAGDRLIGFATAANQVHVLASTFSATQAQQEAGTSSLVPVTPAVQQYHQSAAKVWGYVTVSGGVPTLEVGYNVTSITDTAQGQLTITIATDFSSVNYSVVPSVGIADATFQRSPNVTSTLSAGSARINCVDNTAYQDPFTWGFAMFGDQ